MRGIMQQFGFTATVSLSHFEDLANSLKPFACPPCSQVVQEAFVSQLQSEVTALKDVVAALSDEIHLLKTTIAFLSPFLSLLIVQ